MMSLCELTVRAERASVAARSWKVQRLSLALGRETPGVGPNVQLERAKRKSMHNDALDETLIDPRLHGLSGNFAVKANQQRFALGVTS